MAIRFSLFGRRTSAPSRLQDRAFGSLKKSAADSGRMPGAEAMKHIRDRARERLARADQAFEQSENAG